MSAEIEEIESPELPTNEKANLGDVAVKDPITPTKEEKMVDIDDNVMPVDDKFADDKLDLGNPFDVIDDEEDLLLTDDVNLLDADTSPMIKAGARKNILNSSMKKLQESETPTGEETPQGNEIKEQSAPVGTPLYLAPELWKK